MFFKTGAHPGVLYGRHIPDVPSRNCRCHTRSRYCHVPQGITAPANGLTEDPGALQHHYLSINISRSAWPSQATSTEGGQDMWQPCVLLLLKLFRLHALMPRCIFPSTFAFTNVCHSRKSHLKLYSEHGHLASSSCTIGSAHKPP